MLRFHCTLCGKCCEAGGPELTIDEALALRERFPAAVRLVAGRSGRNPPEILQHMRSFGFIVRAPGRDAYVVYGTIVTLLPEGTACPALEEALCTLHPDKPLVCRTAPFAFNIPSSAQAAAFDRWQAWPCYNHPDGEPVFDGRSIIDSGYRAARDANLAAAAAEQPLYARVVGRMPAEPRARVLEAATGHAIVSIPFANLLEVLLLERRMALDEAVAYARIQLDLVTRMLAPTDGQPARGPMHAELRHAVPAWRRWLAHRAPPGGSPTAGA